MHKRRSRITAAKRRLRVTTIALVGVCAALAGSAFAGVSHDGRSSAYLDPYRGQQLLLSRNAAGDPANGTSTDPAISQDNRTAVVAAFVSDATDIAGNATAGTRNVYLVRRARPYDRDARSPWKIDRVELVSRARVAADGDSWDPSFNGDDKHHATCLAFVSDASNLVAGDRDRQADVFVTPLARKRLKRIPARGDAESVGVDGRCRSVVYATSAGVFLREPGGRTRRIARGASRDATIDSYGRTVAYERAGSVFVWVQGHRARRIGRGSDPAISGNGKIVTFDAGGDVRRYGVRTRRTATVGPGHSSAATLTGVFIFWIHGDRVDATGLHEPAASCPTGPGEPATSAHGNYVLYTCVPRASVSTGRQVFLSYLGAR